MKILLFGILLFIAPFIIQIILWRHKVVKRNPKNIILIFGSTYLLAIIVLVIIKNLQLQILLFYPESIYSIIYSYILTVSIFSAYLLTYSAIESDSPSGLILLKVAKAGDEGITKEDVYAILTDEDTVIERVEGLLRDKRLKQEGEKYFLTNSGRMLLNFILILKRFFNSDTIEG